MGPDGSTADGVVPLESGVRVAGQDLEGRSRRRRVLPNKGMVFAPRRAAEPRRANVRVLGPDGLPLDGRDEPLDLVAPRAGAVS